MCIGLMGCLCVWNALVHAEFAAVESAVGSAGVPQEDLSAHGKGYGLASD